MNNAQLKRLRPFLKGISHKSKLFIYLLAEGISSADIVKLTLDSCAAAVNTLSVPGDILISFESLYANHAGQGGDPIFIYPNGRSYSVVAIEGILARAYRSTGLTYGGVREFTVYISKG